jgi:hypothetical protein
MILTLGDKVLVVHRRLFETDKARFFLGTVEEYESGIARVNGFTFVREQLDGRFIRKEDRRTKIISIASGTLLVYQLSRDLDIGDARIEVREAKLVLADDHGFEMNLSEHAYSS